MAAKELSKSADWRQEVVQDNVQREPSVMDSLDILKVYNKPLGGTIDDEKAGNIITKTPGQEWNVLGDSISLNVLLVRKFYAGYAPRINEFGDVQKDENGNALKDFYYTPEVDVFNKDNIPLGVNRFNEKSRVILGRDNKANFEEYIKSPKVDGVINPLFREVKTNTTTLEKYPTSWIKLGYVVYAQDESGKVYKIIPGGSYGRFNDVKPGTFEDLKTKANYKYKTDYGVYCDPSFINTKIGVRFEDGFYYLDWKLEGFQEKDNRDKVAEVRDLITEFNLERFEGIDFDQPLQALPYNAGGLKIEAPKEDTPSNDVKEGDTEEISISDVPF